MAFVALVTLLALALYAATGVRVGRERHRAHITAPAMTGDPAFERAVRVQENTIEQLVFFLPSLWLAGFLASWLWAGILGLAWIAARAHYAWSYQRRAESRGPGFIAAFAAASTLWLIALIGALMNL